MNNRPALGSRSNSELSRVEPLSGLLSRLFFGLPNRFSVFTQTLSGLTLDWSKVRPVSRFALVSGLRV